jgi:S-DNA-T family DNA segregation ATPase FtsK/SpoIIIE
MLEQRSLKTDVLALIVVAITIFLGAALFTYDPADPPSKLVYPERSTVLNACGRSGATASTLLFSTTGAGAYYLLASLAVLAAVLLTRRIITDPVTRLGGWLISLAGLTSVVAMAAPQLSPGPVIGSGGYLGAAGCCLLEMHFASVGAYILAVSLILGGLLLCTDYVMFRLAAWVLYGPVWGVCRGVLYVLSAYASRLGMPEPSATARRRSVRKTDLNDAPLRISRRVAGEKPEEAGQEPAEAAASEVPVAVVPPVETAKPEAAIVAETPAPQAKPASRGLAAIFRKAKKQPPDAPAQAEVIQKLEAGALAEDEPEYELPSMELLLPSEPFSFDTQEQDVRRKAKILEKTFANFGFNIRVVEIQTGPVIAQFEVELEAGLRLSKITGLADDLAIALRVPSVRIVAPIPGKNTVGIEVPNAERQLVRMREVIEEAQEKSLKMRIPLYLGKDVAGAPLIVDLTTLPHLLIAGRTGTGKSVCLNTIIVSILMTRRPDEVRMLMIDPKMVELSPYKCLPHLMHPVVTDMKKAEAILAWAVEKMEERYALLARAGVRHLSVYNQLGEEELIERIRPENEEERRAIPRSMPYIVIVADEMADLMMTAAKEVEGHIIRLAQKSRAVGIHLVLATQKPTVDVITGLIKSNLPARISFQVASRTDSRVVLDEMGADKLLGNGDMLFLWPGTSTLIRGQGTYLSDDEINQVIASVATTEPQFVTELVQLHTEAPADAAAPSLNHQDDLFEAAVDIVIREGRGSVSLLQRALGIGYGRAARLIDYMAEDGIVGTYNGSQARDVLISLADWEARHHGGAAAAPAAPSAAGNKATPLAVPRRTSNKILLTPAEDAQPDSMVAEKPPASENVAPAGSYEDEEPDDPPNAAGVETTRRPPWESGAAESRRPLDENDGQRVRHPGMELDDDQYDEEEEYTVSRFDAEPDEVVDDASAANRASGSRKPPGRWSASA